MRAGLLNRKVRVERPVSGTDDWGQPVQGWELVDEIMVSIAGETGLGAIRSGLQGGVPASISRYSFMARYQTVKELGIDATMRILYEGLVFEVKGITRDLHRKDRAFIITEQGGNSG
ncbi:head-tail adaptor protein [Stenotrophomonas maltophilia]|uniref:head-tail adaptor protein n=1 Tax=Stenotrophomonas maltophilia TaxID=40324 RepID=UPI0007EFD91F|nr:head-tail adaptor protein [Stenotrophomonas maltophilia]OBU48526.1 phage head-tail joining protein [Stenotrophomonas maltophilia]